MKALACAACLWLVCIASWAQPAAHAPAYVDSAGECTALGGAWLASRANWQANCQVPWGRDECLRLGGGWTPMTAAPAGGVCIAQVSRAATARQCVDAGGTWGPAGSAMPFCQPGTRAAAPLPPASDANKQCDRQSDCIYGCVYHGPAVLPGAEVTGRCRPARQASGCDSMVEKGRLAGTICKQ